MKLKRQEKNELLKLLADLMDLNNKFRGIYNEEIEEIYEEHLDYLEALSGRLEAVKEKCEEDNERKDFLEFLEKCQDTIKTYFLFTEEEDLEFLDGSLKDLQDFKNNLDEAEIDIYLDLPLLSFRNILSFDDAIKLKGLAIHLQKTGERIEKEYDKENDEDSRRRTSALFLRNLKNDANMLKREIEKCDPCCPVDIKVLPLYEQALAMVVRFEDFLEGKDNLENINFALEDFSKSLVSLEEMLAGYNKELKLVGLVHYIRDTGEKLKTIHATMDGEEAEKAIEEVYNFLEDDIQRIESERNTYSIYGEGDKIGIDILEHCREIIESYLEGIEGNDITPVKESAHKLMEVLELVENYQTLQRQSRETGLAQYLIKVGKNLKVIQSSELGENEKEERFEAMLEKLLKDLTKVEEDKKNYFKSHGDDGEEALHASFALKPVEENMKDMFDRSIDVINNYMEFIEGERDTALINESFKISAYIASILEETGQMVDDMQGSISQDTGTSSIIGEA